MTETAQTAIQFTAHYLVHSTVLLTVTWIVLSRSSRKAHWLHDRSWKWAAIAGLATTTFQMSSGLASPVWQFPIHWSASTSPVAVSRTTSSVPDPVVADKPHEGGSQAAPWTEDKSVKRTAAVEHEIPDAVAVPTESRQHDVVISHPATPNLENSRSSWLSTVSGIGVGLFVFCGSLGLIRAANQSRWWQRQLRSARPANRKARAIFDRLLRDAGIRRRVDLLVSPECAEPLALGVLRWRILLPLGIDEELDKEPLRALFAHELAHLVRHDPLWLLVGQLLCTALPFQPLNFVARRRWRAAAEFVCDDWAVRHGVTRLSLAQCLTTVAEWRMNQQVNQLALAAGGNPATLPRRVERLLSDDETDVWQSPWKRRLWSGLVLATIALFAMFAPQLVHAGPESSPPSRELWSQPDAPAYSLSKDSADQLDQLDQELRSLQREIEPLNKLLLNRSDKQTRARVLRMRKALRSLQANYRSLRKITDNLNR